MSNRDPNPSTDFVEKVEGVGTFTFGKRSLRDIFKVGAEYRRLTEGVEDESPEGQMLDTFAQAVADLKVLIVTPPNDHWTAEGLDKQDPFNTKTYDDIMKVWGALRKKEATFRGTEAAGSGQGGDNRTVVPEALQPAA